MPVPSPRNSIRIARGNFADLNANAGAFGEGEFIYAIDQDRFYTASSGVLVAVGAGVVAAEGIDTLIDVDTSTIPPGVGQVLKWDGTKWAPANDSNTDAVTSVAGKTGDVTLVKADITDFADGDYATAAQGATADTAVQRAGDTMTGQLILAEIKETTYTLGTTGSIALDPANGSIQMSVLTGAPTFTDSLEAGQTIVLMLENGDSYTVTWPTMTWVTSSGNAAPTLTAKDAFVLWKTGAGLYGSYVGNYV
jgi:hypothetical protein